jgi:SAM-dependent methyltransferase
MLERLAAKVEKRNPGNVRLRLYDGVSFGLQDRFDFVLLFWMFHEVGNKERFVGEIGNALDESGRVLVVEPRIHVTKKSFEAIPVYFEKIGLAPIEFPSVGLSRAVLLGRA